MNNLPWADMLLVCAIFTTVFQIFFFIAAVTGKKTYITLIPGYIALAFWLSWTIVR